MPDDPSTPLRVLIATTSFPVRKRLVSGVFVERLAATLGQRTDVDIEVVAPDSADQSGEPTPTCYRLETFRYAPRQWQRLSHEPGGIPAAMARSPLLWLLLPTFLLAFFLKLLRRSRKADLIHANWSFTGLLAAIAGTITGTPVITTLRGSDVSTMHRSALRRLSLRVLLKIDGATVAVSRLMQSDLIRAFPQHAKDIHHIPNGVDSRFLDLPIARPGSPRLRLVSIGNLTANKAQLDIIQALVELGDPDISLTLVGDGPERTVLEQHIRLHRLERHVTLTGALPVEQIPDILAEHDALVLASHSEGRPNVVVEAMAAGRIVISSNLPGVAELIQEGNNGLLFPPGHPRDMADRIKQVKAMGERASSLAEMARRTILDLGLSWPDCASDYRKLYETVLAEKR